MRTAVVRASNNFLPATECCGDMEVQNISTAIIFNMYARFGEFFERAKTGICLAPYFF
jgi:hypothetical protein